MIEIIETEKAVKELHESLFWENDDLRWAIMHGEHNVIQDDIIFPAHSNNRRFEIDMGRDNYIWCFSGVRGAGKSISMTFWAIKAAYKYGLRIVSNYNIECNIRLLSKKILEIRSEPLDLYKLLCFDNDYKNCIILIDEAPDVISHMAAMTWKNRLLNIFVRQLRKNHNSLMLGAQEFKLIDKSMRWQTDIIAECTDASRKYGWGTMYRGMCILLRLKDNSGMCTGETYDQAIYKQKMAFVKNYDDPALKIKLYPRALWGDEEHKPVYDTYLTQDVWESLRRVDIKLMTYNLGESALDKSDYLEKATVALREILTSDNPIIDRKDFYTKLQLNMAEKKALGQRLYDAGAERCGTGERSLSLVNFNMLAFQNKDGGAEVK